MGGFTTALHPCSAFGSVDRYLEFLTREIEKPLVLLQEFTV